MQLFKYEIMSENIGLTQTKDSDACSLWKDVPLLNFLTYKDDFVANCHIGGRVCVQHVTEFLMFYLEHHVYTQMCRPRDVFMCVFSH